ncbi:metallo-beta-lactamase family protein (RNase) [Desulforapulum autotrophicum HRM2]|uniref:Metallo-beta-lactamase family protein (RNase) n=1 Tax=Desulforapulum autotrophicum (strain ATCC 43914 / DSM 3382 / VKM B-1955 / HRM2) TaxID=177437 RepID=C0QCN9_DESAH|nr:MBL fold metallo-hydrolase [Desulforapulum autotrophicum]ACN15116.1 metallo-beta-lactamase family protein (RNase) [Desulforapulum autotrophicum HRM2]
MQITHLGGADCVTGSCHLLQANGLNIMVDCGAVQGNDTAVPMERWPVQPCDIDYLFLTHAHVDHIGQVPDLIDKGFKGVIICTHPTLEILFPMLEDAMGFSDRNPSQIEKIKASLEDLAWGFEYGRTFDLKAGIRFKLGNAGHILGSCFIRFESSDPPWSVVFSGDLGPPDTPILPAPDISDPCDLLILESTYGDRLHGDRKERVGRLGRILLKALSDNGKVFVPVFALGRCQELIYEMDRIFGGWEQAEKIPVFVDSPLGLQITNIYSKLSEYWDGEAKALLDAGDHPIDFKNLYAVENHGSHAQLTDIKGPAVILAGSGMCTGGRIVNHLKKGLEDRRNDLLFVGYQAQGTPGRDIVRYSKTRGGYVRLEGKRINIKARVHELTGYSAHADQKDLVNWVNAMEKRPKGIRLVHGDPEAKQALFKRLFS